MAFFIEFNGTRVPMTKVGRDCVFVLEGDVVAGDAIDSFTFNSVTNILRLETGDGDVFNVNLENLDDDNITGFSLSGTDLTIYTDEGNWEADLSTLPFGDTIAGFTRAGLTLTIQTDLGQFDLDLDGFLADLWLLPVVTAGALLPNQVNQRTGGTYSLPNPTLFPEGQVFIYKASSVPVVLEALPNGASVDGSTTYTLDAPSETVWMVNRGNAWTVIANYKPFDRQVTDLQLDGSDLDLTTNHGVFTVDLSPLLSGAVVIDSLDYDDATNDIELVATGGPFTTNLDHLDTSSGQVGDGGDNQNLRLVNEDATFFDVDLKPSFTLPHVTAATYLTSPATAGSNILPHQLNVLNASLGRVYVDLPDPDSEPYPAGTRLHIHRIGDYPILFRGSFLAMYDYEEQLVHSQYPMRGSDIELVAGQFGGGWVWMFREFSDSFQIRSGNVFVNTPINSIIGYTPTIQIALTPESSNAAIVDYRHGQEIVIRIPALFTQPLAPGAQIFLSPDLAPIAGADVPYLQGEPYDSGHPNIYMGHLVREAGSNVSPAGTNYVDWVNERENWVIRLSDERNYVDGRNRTVRLLSGMITWFIIPNTAIDLGLANISDLADDIAANSTDLVTVEYIYWYDSTGNIQVYDHSVPFGDDLMANVGESLVGVRCTIASGKADYRRLS